MATIKRPKRKFANDNDRE